MRIGYKLFAEAYSPQEMVRQTIRAEVAGFDFVEISDHFHPWLYSHGHSGYAWSILAAAATRTEGIELATGVTCPFIRYHPAVVAQAAATTALLSGGRFVLGVGAGERLNEHVVGRGWPAVHHRHAMLRESLEIIRLLWSGGYHSFEGEHLSLEDARVFDLPETAPPIIVAISGPASARIAAEFGDGIFTTEPKPELVGAYSDAGGSGAAYGEVPLSWAPDEASALQSAHEKFRFGLTGWKVQSELPNPVNFEAATAHIREEDMRATFGYGPDPASHLAVARQFADAGFDNLALVNAGPDPDGFFDFFTAELAEPLRRLRAAS
ncbi:TIGR03557 family F420-dependent LLM class oxidoreductase [Nocardiopsis ansamitocini]|uniref:LLM class F420-dependent oxidoreductase n=1 Tax=Nocardiopsis ansamitocini TaxID=1670832 RepID=A0A9W6P2B8_9ACTN|nr:TIGR03557 family F420-dependent LLM class oxidoreductase [Nocardiopsis ansamitocini]GLU45743.1 LLM class F420-dependent oxidoreductase [Nocardiopsis ansamitocini]